MKRNIDRYALAALIAIGVWILIYWLRPSLQIENSPVLVTLDERAPLRLGVADDTPADSEAADATQQPAVEANPTVTPGDAAPTTAPQQAPARADPPPARGSETLEYVVEKGDTLTGIAFALYGRSRDWVLIFNANRLLLDSPEDLRPGMRLIIPPALDPDGDTQQ